MNPHTQNPTDAPKKKFVATGHDRQLQDAQYGHNEVEVALTTGDFLVGRVIRRCRYTITIVTDSNEEFIIFKHAIATIKVVPNAKVS